MRLARCLPFAALVVLSSVPARADAPGRQAVDLELPPNATFLERVHGDYRWNVLCTGRCAASVLPSPYASHAVTMKGSTWLVRIDHGDARVALKKPSLAGPIVGAVIGGTGVMVAITGVSIWVAGAIGKGGPLFEASCSSTSGAEYQQCVRDKEAAQARAERKGDESIATGQAIAAVGAGVMVVGGLVLLLTLSKSEIVKEPQSTGVRLLPRGQRTEAPAQDKAFVVPIVGGRF